MIIVDSLFDTAPYTKPTTPKCFRNTLSCHMISTRPGVAGTRELSEFASKLGMKSAWLQMPGTFREHYNLTIGRRSKAAALGATEVSRAEMVTVMAWKWRHLRSKSQS